MSEILANMVVGANGATALSGRSKGLTFAADRSNFHKLRSSAKAIVIGGQTYRSEPYSNSTIPLYIASRSSTLSSRENKATIIDAPPAEVVRIALAREGSPILIEGGINFVADLINRRAITDLFLTRSNSIGDSHFFDEVKLRENYICSQSQSIEGGLIELWQPISR